MINWYLFNIKLIHFRRKKIWQEDGIEKTEVVKLVDFENVEANDFLITNQFTVQGIDNVCRLDGVVFVNGVPLSILELKSPVREQSFIIDGITFTTASGCHVA